MQLMMNPLQLRALNTGTEPPDSPGVHLMLEIRVLHSSCFDTIFWKEGGGALQPVGDNKLCHLIPGNYSQLLLILY
ncbi:hypothetical protein I79_008269 [Cricetulus griseus]|uniref:Uncharacterized protein n=1 Tax=Cricetulus griseus TaxID=10029 RepID=G3HCQ5_CRIGR|nr:hypothetical protein I79_008269 [Cricetulus griseus]